MTHQQTATEHMTTADVNMRRFDALLDIAAAQPTDPEGYPSKAADYVRDAHTYMIGALAGFIDEATFDAACQRAERWVSDYGTACGLRFARQRGGVS